VLRLGEERRRLEFDRRVARIFWELGRQHGRHVGTAAKRQCQHEYGYREPVFHAPAGIASLTSS
jgi:hypothetical protein